MNKREQLIEKYVEQLTDAGVKVDRELLTKVTVGLGPSIYNADSSTVASSDASELATVKNNYLIKKLGLEDSTKLDESIDKVIDTLDRSNRNKYRSFVYYLLCHEFGKQAVYQLTPHIPRPECRVCFILPIPLSILSLLS